MHRNIKLVALFSLVTAISGCGSGNTEQPAPASQQSKAQRAQQAAAISPSADAVQQLYIAYFGRPADGAGLLYFESLLKGANAPVTLPAIASAYNDNAALRAIVDVFSGSQESRDLYYGDTSYFIKSVYLNLFNRTPDPAGEAFWISKITNGQLSRAAAALTIMSSAQGSDVDIVRNKVLVAAKFTTAAPLLGSSTAYSGMGANFIVRGMLSKVSEWSDLDALDAEIAATIAIIQAPLLMVSPAVATATIYPGDSVHVVIEAATRDKISSYRSAKDMGGALSPGLAINFGKELTGSYYIAMTTRHDLTPGVHKGSVELRMCHDLACASEYPGSPVRVPYAFTVLAPTRLTPLSRAPGVAEWETFQGNAAHTGYVPLTLDTGKFSLRWRWSPPGERQSARLGSTFNGQLFVVSSSGTVFALREHDGVANWSRDFNNGVATHVHSPAAANGLVYVKVDNYPNAAVHGLHAASGATAFTSDASTGRNERVPVTVAGGKLYASGGALYAYDAASGARLWAVKARDGEKWTPTVANGRVYLYHPVSFGSPGSAVLASYDAASGAMPGELYHGKQDTQSTAQAVVAGEAHVLYTAAIGLTRFNTAANKVDWAIDGGYFVAPALAGAVMYAANQKPYQLEARSALDGSLLWKWSRDNSWGTGGFRSNVVATDNLVFVSDNNVTYAMDISTRRVAWSFPQSGQLALSPNGILYISGIDSITAINVK